jgi:hypothetical protein
MAKMRAVQVARAGGPLELVEREMPEPARAEFHHPVPARGWVPGRVRFGATPADRRSWRYRQQRAIRRRSCGRGRASAIGSVKGPSRGR